MAAGAVPLSRRDTFDNTARTADRVDQNVYISGYIPAANPDFVYGNGITRIVKLFADDPSYPGGATRLPGVSYLVIPAEDRPDYDIVKAAVPAMKFIREGLRKGERILVHCHMGVSRSATVVILHLMINRRYILQEAYARLRMTRPWIWPNEGFMRQLRDTDARMQKLRVGDEKRYTDPPPIYAGDAFAKLGRIEAAEKRKK